MITFVILQNAVTNNGRKFQAKAISIDLSNCKLIILQMQCPPRTVIGFKYCRQASVGTCPQCEWTHLAQIVTRLSGKLRSPSLQ